MRRLPIEPQGLGILSRRPRMVALQPNIGKDKSFADDLNKEQGIVSSRVALLLRSTEIKPLFNRFVPYGTYSPLHGLMVDRCGGASLAFVGRIVALPGRSVGRPVMCTGGYGNARTQTPCHRPKFAGDHGYTADWPDAACGRRPRSCAAGPQSSR